MPRKNRSPFVQGCDSEAAKLRKRHGFSYNNPLNPFVLADSLGIKVIEPKDISGISQKDLETINSLEADWSGLSFSLPNGHLIVVLNPFHEQERKNITLMEEICHFIYNHKPKTKVQLSGSQEIDFLDFTKKNEKEAYWIGASVLVPYKVLDSLVKKGKTLEEIALHFGVSTELIEFRLKVERLLGLYRAKQKVRELLSSS